MSDVYLRTDNIVSRGLTRLVSLLLLSTVIQISVAATEPETQQASDQNSVSALVEQINVLRQDLESQQSALGAYDNELLASLNQLSEALITAGAYQEAQLAIEEQIQIVRINDGLYSEAQLALINQQLAIHAARGNWAAMQDRLQYISWIFDRNTHISADEKLAGLKTARDWTRLLLTRGPREMEPLYLLQLRSFEQSSLQIARDTMSAPQMLQSYIYDQAISELYIALGIVTPSDTSRMLINRIDGVQSSPLRPGQRVSSVADLEAVYGARTSTVIERSHRSAMSRHFQLIEELADIHSDTGEGSKELKDDKPELAAMIQLHLGDSMLLRTQYELRFGTNTGPARGSASTGIAARYYDQAWQLFIESGYSNEELNQIFACPALLPLPTFENSLGAATAPCNISQDGSIDLPDAYALRNGVPGIRHEGVPDYAIIAPAAGSSTTLQFEVGVNGQAERIQILASEPDSTTSRIRGRDSLTSLQFRPALRDGRAIRTPAITIKIYTVEPD
jgi:hypothetical protein